MKRLFKFALPPLLIVFAVAAVVVMSKNRPVPEQREPVQAALLVDTIRPQPSDERFRIAAQGTVRPRTETTLVAEVSGTIVRLSESFVAGGFFQAGTVLAEIDPSDYQAALLQAEAELASARAQLSDEQARSDAARADWERLHGSTREANELVLRLPQLARAQASVQAQEAAVLRARRNLERTRIRLPYDGLVKRREVDLGQYVSAGSHLGVAFAVDVAEIRLPLSDRDLAFVDLPAPGRIAEVETPVILSGMVGGQMTTWEGRVVRTEGVVDESTRLVYVVAQIEDPYGLLGTERGTPLPMGTFAEAEIAGRTASGLLMLPRMALRDGDLLYIADDQDQLEVRRVDVVRTTPERVYLRNDLTTSDRVITTAISAPIPGLALRVRETDPEQPVLRILPAGDIAARAEGGENG